MANQVTLISEPTVILLGEMRLRRDGLNKLRDWVASYRPECLPEEDGDGLGLFPHGLEETHGDVTRTLSDNEMLVELAGRNCYHSYGLKAGRKTNREYIAHSQSGTIPHRSIMYHAKMSFFLAGISRRVSHELIRHYVGADRDEEGSPSMESTRYTLHPGHFVTPPRVLKSGPEAVEAFRHNMQVGYHHYLNYIRESEDSWIKDHGGLPKGMDRKRIYEAAAGQLPMQAATSLVWTSNPVALNKMFTERTDETTDAEYQRFALVWQAVCKSEGPNLFP